MRASCTEVLNLRLPADLRASLAAESRQSGVTLSAATRTALAVGLRALNTPTDPDTPRPAGPAPAMSAAA